MTETTQETPKPVQAFFVATVVEKFSTRKQAEDYANKNELASDECILKGRELTVSETTRVTVN